MDSAKPSFTTRAATKEDASNIVKLYIASRKDALPTLNEVHTDEGITRWITNTWFEKAGEVYVAETDGLIVGVIRVIGDDLDQLYLLPGYYRHGIGSQLLQKAKELSPERLTLFTFQVNQRARAFYEKHGFRIVDMNDGERNEEKEPDILYEWKPSN